LNLFIIKTFGGPAPYALGVGSRQKVRRIDCQPVTIKPGAGYVWNKTNIFMGHSLRGFIALAYTNCEIGGAI